MGFQALINILAELYPTHGDARRIIASANIDHRLVDFDGNALAFWYDIFHIATKQDKVFKLLSAVEFEYSDSQEFIHQSRAYFRDIAELAVRANDQYSSFKEPEDMATITDSRLDRLETSFENMQNRQNEVRDKVSEMSGQMTMLLSMVEQLSHDKQLSSKSIGGPPLTISLFAIIGLVGIILWLISNSGI